MVVVALFQEGEVGGLGKIGLVVQEVEDAHRLPAQHVDDGLEERERERDITQQITFRDQCAEFPLHPRDMYTFLKGLLQDGL